MQGDGAIVLDFALVFEQEQLIEVHGGIGVAQALGGLRPALQWGLLIEAAVRLLVVFALDPQGQAPIQRCQTGGVPVGEFGGELGAAGAEEALDFPFSLGLERPGVDQRYTELGADQRKLVGSVIRTVINVMCPVALCGDSLQPTD